MVMMVKAWHPTFTSVSICRVQMSENTNHSLNVTATTLIINNIYVTGHVHITERQRDGGRGGGGGGEGGREEGMEGGR